jgi:hypothetical protein
MPIQQYHDKNKLIFNEMMMRSTLHYTNSASWIFIVVVHWNNSLFHLDTLFRFRANQSLLFFLNAARLAEKQQIPILYPLVWPDHLPHSRVMPPMRLLFYDISILTSISNCLHFVHIIVIKNRIKGFIKVI